MERPPSSRDVIGTYLARVGTIRSGSDMTQQSSIPSWTEPIEEAGADATAATADVESPAVGESDADAANQRSRLQLVLSFLARTRQMPLTELAGSLQIPTLEAATLLTKLSSTGLISIEGDPGRELVSITDAGLTIAELAAS